MAEKHNIKALHAVFLILALLAALQPASNAYARVVAQFSPPLTSSIQAPVTGNYSPPPSNAPTSGVLRVAVIAAEFSDVNHTRTIDSIRQDYTGPFTSYYKEVSYGLVTIRVDVFGWYRLEYPQSHYGMDCRAIDDADCSGSDQSWQIAQDAAKSAKDVDFSKYDYYVFLHSGYGEESAKNIDPNTVWSVTYLAGVYILTPTVTLSRFSIVPEEEATGAVPLGVYCHEFGHLLGLPDLYNTANGQTRNGVWELMDKGLWNGNPPGSMPAEMSAWDRLKLGWLPSSAVKALDVSDSGLVNIQPLENSGDITAAAKVQVSSNVYYMIEVRQPIGYDKGLPSYGAVAYIVDTTGGGVNMQAVDMNNAFGAGYLYQATGRQSSADFRVLAHFANGTFAVGFGATAFVQAAVLIINFSPASINATAIVNGQTFGAGPNGAVTVLDYSGNSKGFDVTVTDTIPAGTGVRQKFGSWSTGSTSNRLSLPSQNVTVTASYTTQYQLTVNQNGGDTTPTGWYDASTQIMVTAKSPSNVVPNSSRLIFQQWSGDYQSQSANMTITVVKPTTLTANWKTQYYVNVISAAGSVTGAGWYDIGAQATISLQSSSVQTSASERQMFAGWSGGASGQESTVKIAVSSPTTIEAKWTTQYLVVAQSPYGNPQGSGWYDANAVAQVSVSPEIDYDNQTRRIFTQWSGDYTGNSPTVTLSVDRPKTLAAGWATQYEVTFSVSGLPDAVSTQLVIDGKNYDVNSSKELQIWISRGERVNPIQSGTIAETFATTFRFSGWQNSTGNIAADSPLTITQPENYVATYHRELTPTGFAVVIIIAIIGVVAALTLRKRNTSRAKIRRKTPLGPMTTPHSQSSEIADHASRFLPEPPSTPSEEGSADERLQKWLRSLSND